MEVKIDFQILVGGQLVKYLLCEKRNRREEAAAAGRSIHWSVASYLELEWVRNVFYLFSFIFFLLWCG